MMELKTCSSLITNNERRNNMKKIFITLTIISITTILSGCNINKEKYDKLKGTWKAPIENQIVHDNTKEKEEYILECDGKGLDDLRKNKQDLANSRYTIYNNKVTFYDEGRKILAICNIINEKELDCSEKTYYSYKYIKIEK